jgi:hypothetical protein
MNEREQNQLMVKLAFEKLATVIKRAIATRDTTRAELEKIESRYGLTDEFKQQLKQPVQAAHNQVWGELYADFGAAIEALGQALTAWHGDLDLTDPALANALKMIELSKGDLPTDLIMAINRQFTGKQPQLRALQAVYKSQGVIYDGGLEKQVYELEPALEGLSDFAYNTFVRGGSLNGLAAAVAKVAEMEGVEFEKTPDQVGMVDAIRQGAGLPVGGGK